MPRKTHNELAAGLFILVSLAAILGIVLWLGAADMFHPSMQDAYFYITEEGSPGELGAGSLIKIGGAPIGKVARVDPDPATGRVYYIAKIEDSRFKIHSDSRARIQAGMIGGAALAVTRGSQGQPLADRAHAIKITGGLDQAMNDIASAAEVIKNELDPTRSDAILSQIKKVVELLVAAAGNISRETDAKQASLMAKLHAIFGDVADLTADIKPKLKQTASDVADVAAQFKKYTNTDVADILAKLRETNTQVLKVAKDFATVSEQAKQMVLVNRDSIDEMIDNMTIVSEDLKAAAKEVRRNPWRLLYQPSPEELKKQNLYDASRAFLGGAEQLDQALAKLKALALMSPEGIDPKDPKLLEIRKQVDETFEKFKKAEDFLWKEMK